MDPVVPASAACGPDRRPKVFCVSMQRTGTSSVGKFFRDFGFKWAGWPADEQHNWSGAWYDGDFERIFSAPGFLAADAFEDSPWFMPDFYKVLFHRFPGARFVLFTREPDAWFASMLAHSDGDIIGTGRIHCRIYRREQEYLDLVAAGRLDPAVENQLASRKTMKLWGRDEHYKAVYRLHNAEVREFFGRHSPGSLHVGALEDPDKWRKLGRFLGIDVPQGYVSHANASAARAASLRPPAANPPGSARS